MINKKLSQKHKLFAKNLIKTKGRQGKAYQLTYPDANEDSANNSASRLLAKHPEIKQYIVEVLDRKGMTIEDMATKLKRMLNAKKEIVMSTGEVVKVVDNPTRMTALKTGFELHGVLKTGVNINTDNRSINIGMSERDLSEVKSLTNKLEQLNNALALDTGTQSGEIIDADFSKTDDTMAID